MENKEYLSEEEYKKNAQKLKTIGLIVLIIGIIVLVISIIMIFVGFLGFGNTVNNGIESFDSGSLNSSSVARGTIGSFGLFAIGGFMNVLGFGVTAVGGILLFIAHRREITAFTTQQVMPVAQEGIDKMTPTVSDAVGSVAKSITKGIAEGKKEAEIDKDVL